MLVNKTENAWSNHESKDGLEEIDQVEKRRARVDRKQDLPK